MATPRVWLITGASSGFGRSLTELVLTKGDIVVATLRKPEVLQDLVASYSAEKLLVVKVDVTNRTDIDHAFARTKEVFGRLDIVFNNAGFVAIGDAETTPADTAQGIFDVNFWGAVYVSQAAVKFFREVNEPGRGGILLQNSSIAANMVRPGSKELRTKAYLGTLVALDGFSESLAKEILPQWNIKICILCPGAFDTSVLAKANVQPVNQVYNQESSLLASVWSAMDAGTLKFEGDPVKFVKAIYTLVESGDIPLRLPIGKDALAMGRAKVELLQKQINEAEPLSADLLLDGVTPS